LASRRRRAPPGSQGQAVTQHTPDAGNQGDDPSSLQFPNRFTEWCQETGKKVDLMFVQHMLGSLKPYAVLFRGGKEKLIREILINDDVTEAIISLPPGLFYGTGIPARVLACNKYCHR
jgi:type I restriction enzyme M protein